VGYRAVRRLERKLGDFLNDEAAHTLGTNDITGHTYLEKRSRRYGEASYY